MDVKVHILYASCGWRLDLWEKNIFYRLAMILMMVPYFFGSLTHDCHDVAWFAQESIRAMSIVAPCAFMAMMIFAIRDFVLWFGLCHLLLHGILLTRMPDLYKSVLFLEKKKWYSRWHIFFRTFAWSMSIAVPCAAHSDVDSSCSKTNLWFGLFVTYFLMPLTYSETWFVQEFIIYVGNPWFSNRTLLYVTRR